MNNSISDQETVRLTAVLRHVCCQTCRSWRLICFKDQVKCGICGSDDSAHVRIYAFSLFFSVEDNSAALCLSIKAGKNFASPQGDMTLQYLSDTITDVKRFGSLQHIDENLIKVDPGWEPSKSEESEAISRAVSLYGPGANIYFLLYSSSLRTLTP
ncbi:hypothetical protein GGI35DRAFT_201889 [Trichoderma velutinum]